MSDTATIIDNYLAARAGLCSLLGEADAPDIADWRGYRWGIAQEPRRSGGTRDVLWIMRDQRMERQFCQHGHVPESMGDGITIVREKNPQENTVFLLTTAMRDDEAASQKAAT
jgi:hypothetical protein